MLTSRGCWRNCAFCSINAWYERVGGKKFRVRSTASIVAEVADLYHNHGVRVFNFQDDNFFLPKPDKAARRFAEFRDGLRQAGVGQIAIMVKARPDSITRESVAVWTNLGCSACSSASRTAATPRSASSIARTRSMRCSTHCASSTTSMCTSPSIC